jgi:hypothetical protein
MLIFPFSPILNFLPLLCGAWIFCFPIIIGRCAFMISVHSILPYYHRIRGWPQRSLLYTLCPIYQSGQDSSLPHAPYPMPHAPCPMRSPHSEIAILTFWFLTFSSFIDVNVLRALTRLMATKAALSRMVISPISSFNRDPF